MPRWRRPSLPRVNEEARGARLRNRRLAHRPGGRPSPARHTDPPPPRLVPLGYGKFVRADRVFALVPLEGGERGDGRRTLVYVDGVEGPIVASRSEGPLARDVAEALGQASPRGGHEITGQEALF